MLNGRKWFITGAAHPLCRFAVVMGVGRWGAPPGRWTRPAARTEVSAIKLVSSRLQPRVLNRAMQVFGAMRLSPDTPLARLWAWGRALRFLDGPDEAHLRPVARAELKRAKGRRGANAAHLRRWLPVER